MIYTQRNTQIFSFSVYTVLSTLKNATQYTLYTQKTILYFMLDNKISIKEFGGDYLEVTEQALQENGE